MMRTIRILENRLDKVMIKYNEAQSIQQTYEQVVKRLKEERVAKSDIENTQSDIKRIKKDLYFRIIGHVKKHPIAALVLSSIFALMLGITGSVIGSFVYEYLKSRA